MRIPLEVILQEVLILYISVAVPDRQDPYYFPDPDLHPESVD
jgi:hypothetical protein